MQKPIDEDLAQELVARFEWLEMAFIGHQGKPGLMDRLEELFQKSDDPTSAGVFQRVDELLEQTSSLQHQLNDIHETFKKSFLDIHLDDAQETLIDSVKVSTKELHDEIRDVSRASKIASDRVTSSASQAELALRSATEELQEAEASLNQTLPVATQQLKMLLKEAQSALGSDQSLDNLRMKMESLCQSLVLENQGESLRKSWNEIQELFLKEQQVTLQRQVEAIQEIVLATQTESLENVKKLIEFRTPSEAIVQLFQQLDEAKSENQQLKQKISNVSHTHPRDQRLIESLWFKNGPMVILLFSSLGLVTGALGMWGLLIGFR